MAEATHDVFIALGSNIEPREERLKQAAQKLRTVGSVVRASSVYETAPVGYNNQPNFYNAVVEVKTDLDAKALLNQLRAFEQALGREQRERWHEREIDFDILYFDNLVMNEPGLTIPHLELQSRKFVLAPLVEIAPLNRHPVLMRTNTELLVALEERIGLDQEIHKIVSDFR